MSPRKGLPDFTDASALGVTIAGEPLAHRLYHFGLASSDWQHVHVLFSDESFRPWLKECRTGYGAFGGAPAEHRSDSLSAAFRNLSRDAAIDYTRR